MSQPIEKRYALTITTTSEKPHHRVFWFGRVDMKDNLRPVRVEARNGREAWAKLKEKVEPPCSST